MFSSLKKIFSPAPFTDEAHAAYVTLVEQSRKPWFYAKQAVPDTVDGRFDIIVLHLFMIIHRLRGEETQAAAEFARALSEVFFSDMDRNIREMGSTDTGVGKRIRNMAQAFYGRLSAYENGMIASDKLREALKTNLYRASDIISETQLVEMENYIKRNRDQLAGQPLPELLAGRLRFLD
jgi:cytochrome b pre-mRNA-processing protein 3